MCTLHYCACVQTSSCSTHFVPTARTKLIPPMMNMTPRPTMVEAEIHTITIGTKANLWEEVEEGRWRERRKGEREEGGREQGKREEKSKKLKSRAYA